MPAHTLNAFQQCSYALYKRTTKCEVSKQLLHVLWSSVKTERQTDGRTDMMKLMGDFRDCLTAPKMAGI